MSIVKNAMLIACLLATVLVVQPLNASASGYPDMALSDEEIMTRFAPFIELVNEANEIHGTDFRPVSIYDYEGRNAIINTITTHTLESFRELLKKEVESIKRLRFHSEIQLAMHETFVEMHRNGITDFSAISSLFDNVHALTMEELIFVSESLARGKSIEEALMMTSLATATLVSEARRNFDRIENLWINARLQVRRWFDGAN